MLLGSCWKVPEGGRSLKNYLLCVACWKIMARFPVLAHYGLIFEAREVPLKYAWRCLGRYFSPPLQSDLRLLQFFMLKDVLIEMLPFGLLGALGARPWGAFSATGVLPRKAFTGNVYRECCFGCRGCISTSAFGLLGCGTASRMSRI